MVIKKEKIIGLHLGSGFREWDIECEIDDSKPVYAQKIQCKRLSRGSHPETIKTGVWIKTDWGTYGFDMIELKDKTRILYPNPRANFI